MVADEKHFQAGDDYAGDHPRQSSADFFSDPAKVAETLVKDLAAVGTKASLPEILDLIKTLLSPGQPQDDKKGTTELLISILTALPSDSEARRHLTNVFIDLLWSSLQHPPLSYLGGDIKYEVVGSTAKPGSKPADIIEFKVPGTDVTLRGEVPQAPDGLFQYRMPDGGFNNILQPNLGKAGTPYAKTVKAAQRLQGVKPDPGLLFDLLMARDDENYKENSVGVSSMFFYHATIIIHDLFRTNRTDLNISDVSSYLDLAPLYGSSLKEQFEVRTMKEGKLKPDAFSEMRLLGQPAGVNVMLVLYNRFHNYVADILLKINEGGRFTLSSLPTSSPEEKAKALAKQDHDIFNTARLIVVGLYVNIAMHDYLRAITNTHYSTSDWTLDPRVDITKQYDGEGVPRGVGNQVSAEFNLLYRFHSCISKKDENWINNFFLKLFPGQNPDDLQNVSWTEIGKALATFEAGIPKDPAARTFDGLERQANGTFNDADLVRILKEAMDDPASVFGARTIPKALRAVEILGIYQSRKWGMASLNEFREFFGLKRWEKFTDINPDPDIAGLLEKLYADPDMVEFYPGIMVEETKPLRSPGIGVNLPYTLSRAVLSDAITLVRSDRFNTVDYTVSNLTNWGYNEVQSDPKTLGGSMLYKLIQRGLPGWFPYNSVAVMQPMYTKQANAAIAKKLGTIAQYTLDDPKPPAKPVVVISNASTRKVLGNPKVYVVPWLPPVNDLFPGKKDFSWFMLSGDGPQNKEQRTSVLSAFHKIPNLREAIRETTLRVGAELIKSESFALKEGLNQVDLIRDVAIPLNARLLADLFYLDLKSDENPDGVLGTVDFYENLLNIRTWGTNNNDPGLAWNRRRLAQDGAALFTKTTRVLVDEVVRARGLGLGIATALSNTFSRKTHLKKDSLRSWGYKLVEELLSQGLSPERVTDTLWLTSFGGVGVPVTAFYEVLEFFLRQENASIWSEVQTLVQQGDDTGIYNYVKEAQRLTSTQRTIRIAIGQDEVDNQQVAPGNLVILNLRSQGDAGRNKAEIPDADIFNPKRDFGDVSSFGHGQHECVAGEIALQYIVNVLKIAADLKNLRPAPGQMGVVKTVNVGGQELYLNDSWSYLAFDASTWKVHYDGRGKGNFTGERQPTKPLELQQYYHSIQKKQTDLLGSLGL
ncbi:linoleate diol synthase [Xylaria intraflava]|nr:linoleate diol synthase [Xylaria intraflava]